MLIFASPMFNFLPQLFPLAKNIVMFDWFDIVFRPSPAEYIFSFELRFIFLYFEKSKRLGIVPCYQDNEIGLKKIISKKLKGFEQKLKGAPLEISENFNRI